MYLVCYHVPDRAGVGGGHANANRFYGQCDSVLESLPRDTGYQFCQALTVFPMSKMICEVVGWAE